MRKLKKILIAILMLACLLPTLLFPAYAMGALSARGSATSVPMGTNCTLTVTLSGRDSHIVGTAKVVVSFPKSMYEYVSHKVPADVDCTVGNDSFTLVWNNTSGAEKAVCTFTLKPIAEGTQVTTVHVRGATDSNGQPMSYSLTSTIYYTVLPAGFFGDSGGGNGGGGSSEPKLSSEARLSELTVEGGTLSPAFAPSTYEYAVSVPPGTTEAKLSLALKDDDASYSVSNTALAVGENKVTISTKAEDGSTKTYTLTITRPPTPFLSP